MRIKYLILHTSLIIQSPPIPYILGALTSTMEKNELILMLKNQFGIYLREEDEENAFDHTMKILEKVNFSNEVDIFQSYLHLLILDLDKRINILSSKLENLDDKNN